MGRPKLSDLSCTVCDMKFKRKSLLDEHMEIHSSSRQPRKLLKNYCYVCRKSFDPDKYKIHIQTEHQFDFPNMKNKNEDDFYSCENGFVLLSKKKFKKETDSPKQFLSPIEKNKSLIVSVTDIKIEPIDKVSDESDYADYQTDDKIPVQKNALKHKIQKLKCTICGMRCKGKKGLKIHMSAHKRSHQSSYDDASPSENENNEDSNLNQSSKSNDVNVSSSNANVPLLLSNNGAINYAQNAQSNYILNVSQFQNQSNSAVNFGNQFSNLLTPTNQANTQFLQSIPNQKSSLSDGIPTFDCDSEKYMKWLKNFVSKCRMQNYPLNPDLCRKISIVTGEITDALGNPKSSLKQKSNHFYFMSTYNILTEIMLSHLQYTLCGVVKK